MLRERHRFAANDAHANAPLVRRNDGVAEPMVGEEVHGQRHGVAGGLDQLHDAPLVAGPAVAVAAARRDGIDATVAAAIREEHLVEAHAIAVQQVVADLPDGVAQQDEGESAGGAADDEQLEDGGWFAAGVEEAGQIREHFGGADD